MLDINIDIHTHSGGIRKDAVLCIDPVVTRRLPDGDGLLSVGIHPANADKTTPLTWQLFDLWLDDPRVIAVGETGFDRLVDVEVALQEKVFVRQARAAAAHNFLPLVLHCVRASDILLRMRKELLQQFGSQLNERHEEWQWIFHGFRGKPDLAEQLLRAGIDLSFGKRYNSDSFNLTPSERRYRETD